MSKGMRHPNGNQVGIGEPPPWLKHIIWLLKFENWRKYWKAIVIGLAIALLTMLRNLAPTTPKSTEGPETHQAPVMPTPSQLLSNSETQSAIRRALHREDLIEAMRLLASTRDSLLRTEECEHVFDYAIKNHKLGEATTVVNSCWQGASQRARLSQIEHEKIKR